jgi:UDP-N-acetylglucosamine 2-epimerase (non-hydrolysing)
MDQFCTPRDAHIRVTKPLVIFGTRPEWIKLRPVIDALRRRCIEPVVVFTGQHKTLVDDTDPNATRGAIDLGLMSERQTPDAFMSRALEGITSVAGAHSVDAVVVQGDTTSTLAGALAGFYLRLRVAHVEAGLRTGLLDDPFPEEGHRQLVARVAWWHFCPTAEDAAALFREGVARDRVRVVGNTGIDALRERCAKLGIEPDALPIGTTILVTLHRRESLGGGLRTIATALRRLAQLRPEVRIVLPLHPNPAVREEIIPLLAGLSNVELREAMPRDEFLRTLAACRFVITDSGGVQEEAPWLGRPVLVVRNKTERRAGVSAGVAFLTGTDHPERILDAALRLTDSDTTLRVASAYRALYGDGYAADRIASELLADVVRRDAPTDLIKSLTA